MDRRRYYYARVLFFGVGGKVRSGNSGEMAACGEGAGVSAAELARVNRALRMLSSSNRALVRIAGEDELLREICRIVVEHGGYRVAMVRFVEHDEAKSLRMVAHAGFEDGYAESVPLTWSADHPLGRGPAGIAARTGHAAVLRDFIDHPDFGALRGEAVRRGYRSVAGFPLSTEGRTFGVLTIYSVESDAFDAEEMPILEELAADLAFGIVALRMRFRHQVLEARLEDDLKYFAAMDRVNLAIQQAGDLDTMMRNVLDAVLDVLDCDRASLLHPCDPDAETWKITMECTRPEHPGLFSAGLARAMSPEVSRLFSVARETRRVLHYGSVSERFPSDPDIEAEFGKFSALFVAVHPKLGEPWGFSVHDCSGTRQWTAHDRMLFQEVSRRIADGLTGYLAYRDLQARETDLRVAAAAFETQEAIFITDAERKIQRVNRAFTEMTGYDAAEVVGRHPSLLRSGYHDDGFYKEMWGQVDRTGAWQGEIWNVRKNGEIYPEWLSLSVVKDEHGIVTHYVAATLDISKRKEAENEIERLAYYDVLTQLPNRRLLLNRLPGALASCVQTRRHGGLLFIDLDDFKTLNDTAGHDVGDLLLAETARRLRHCVREADTVARLGGDEFVVLLEDLSESVESATAHARLIGEKIQSALASPYALAGCTHHVTSSIGVTVFSGSAQSVDELLKQADIAMYQAKSAGRNTLRFFDPDMQAVLSERAAMESDLRAALGSGQFTLNFQTQVNAEHGVVGAEALLRWHHPVRGQVPPGQFIPVAEDTGLIVLIGHWVLQAACATLAAWAGAERTRHLRLAVNVSARQFRQPDFVDQVLNALAASGAPASRLKLELTESLVLDDVDDTVTKMRALKARGVGFSMDDFGTGYSSLAYLTRLPLDQLKIDQSFVRNLPDNTNDAVIARTIITMAQSLGLAVIAEGVETEAQREFLARHGCPTCQGYLFGKPMAQAEFEASLLA